jgi:neopullulanase
MMFTLRGVPVVYSGDEQGFAGDGIDQDAREDLFASQVASYNNNRLVGAKATTAQSNFDQTHPLFRAIAQLSKLRREQPALRRGKQIIRSYADKPGLFAVSRIDPQQGTELLAAFNTSTTPLESNLEVGAGMIAFTSLQGDCMPKISAQGSYRVRLQPLSYVICAARTQGESTLSMPSAR